MKRLRRTRLVSFSGIDGAGKTSQITALTQYLEEQHLRFRLLRFWDDVVALSAFRERVSLRVFKGDRGVGSSDRPIRRRDKDVSSPSLHLVRLFFYALDAWKLAMLVRRSSPKEILVFDRYIYDELANLPLQHKLVRLYIRVLLWVIPEPNLALLLDADPESATARKPEYPLEFVRRNRNAYLTLASMAGMEIIPPSTPQDIFACIRRLFRAEWRTFHRNNRNFHLEPTTLAADPSSSDE